MSEETVLGAEEWRPVVGLEEWYDVSNMGRVRSWRKNGKGHRQSSPKSIVGAPDKDGYLRVGLYSGDGTGGPRKNKQIHRLVLEAFYSPRPAGMEAAHLNGNPHDNRACNLRWVTHTENIHHQKIHGTTYRPIGEKHPMARLTDEAVKNILTLRRQGFRYKDIASEHNVSTGAIAAICRRENWKHIQIEREATQCCQN